MIRERLVRDTEGEGKGHPVIERDRLISEKRTPTVVRMSCCTSAPMVTHTCETLLSKCEIPIIDLAHMGECMKSFLWNSHVFFIFFFIFYRSHGFDEKRRRRVRATPSTRSLREIHDLRFKFTIVKLARGLDPVCREMALRDLFTSDKRFFPARTLHSNAIAANAKPGFGLVMKKHLDVGCRKSVIGRPPDDEINVAWQN